MKFPPDFFLKVVESPGGNHNFSSGIKKSDITVEGGAKGKTVEENEQINLCVLMPNLGTATLVVSVGF